MFAHKSVPLTFMPTRHSLLGRNPIFPQLQLLRIRGWW